MVLKCNVVMKIENVRRVIFYFLGLGILSLGLILNTKSNFGVSPILSVAYCISQISGQTLATITLYQYIIFVIVEIVLHVIGKVKNLKMVIFKDLAQIIVTIIFTTLMDLFAEYIIIPTKLITRILFMILGIILTGIGCAMSLDMRIVPNPGDGIVQSIADFVHKRVGITKNIFDLCSVTVTCIISFIFAGKLIGIGIGTIACVIGVGRVVSYFNDICKVPLQNRCGVVE